MPLLTRSFQTGTRRRSMPTNHAVRGPRPLLTQGEGSGFSPKHWWSASRCSGNAARSGIADSERTAYDQPPQCRDCNAAAVIPIEGHFSAHGMPDRPCVISPACGSAVRTSARDLGHSSRMPPEGRLGSCFRRSGPALSNGTGEFVEVAARPQARGEVLGNAPGANARLIASGESRSTNFG
jgi:hypothetical protein